MDDMDKTALKTLGILFLSALIAILLMWLVTILFPQPANAADLPEYADVTFTDIADLDRQCDSVLAVCIQDSIEIGRTKCIPCEIVYDYFQVCRRFAGREIWEMPTYEEWVDGSIHLIWNGKARLWWWEERSE